MFKIMYNKIIDLVNKKTGLDIRKRSRKQDYVFSRCIYYDIAYNHLKLGTLYEVAKQLGLDHSTVIHSLKNILPILDNYAPEFITIRDEVLEILDYEVDYNEDIKDMIRMIREMPEDKASTLKTRLEPIIYMICR